MQRSEGCPNRAQKGGDDSICMQFGDCLILFIIRRISFGMIFFLRVCLVSKHTFYVEDPGEQTSEKGLNLEPGLKLGQVEVEVGNGFPFKFCSTLAFTLPTLWIKHRMKQLWSCSSTYAVIVTLWLPCGVI